MARRRSSLRRLDAVRRLAPGLTTPAVVAVKSTVPVGTALRLAEILRVGVDSIRP
ncbi:hypothetical protein [Streptomyces sp. NPDC000410]|uniref:hypothetical protein n=1 Tax=Streptomyces sp. NPDC000410 TaxID=3154254 RepID=UPI003318BD5C